MPPLSEETLKTLSSLLPKAAAASPEKLAEQAIAREAERGERIVAWTRALLTTSACIMLAVITLAAGRNVHGEAWVPVILSPSMVFGWFWLVYIHRRPYHRYFPRISSVIDVFMICGFMLFELEMRGSPALEGVVLGSLPPFVVLMFLAAAVGVRQDPTACLVAGGLAFLLTVLIVLRARSLLPPNALPATVAYYGTFGPWAGRGLVFLFLVAMVAFNARNVNRMARATGLAVAEQNEITNLFGRYVDPEIARSVMSHEGRVAETREVTVVFTDLRDFTGFAERSDPQEVLEALNDHYDAIIPFVHKHGGTVNKFIGDAIMATFGAPIRHDDHAARAVAAGTQMLEAMVDLNAKRRRLGRPELRMGVGIATGPVVVGTLGTTDRVEYAVIGDTVNTASRLEGLCKELGCSLVMGSSTHEAVADRMATRTLGAVSVKGKADKLEVFTVAGAPLSTTPEGREDTT